MTYTYEQTLDLLKEIVSSKGEDYVYPHSSADSDQECRYYERGMSKTDPSFVGPWSPSCLVGHVFDRVMDEDAIAKVIRLYNTSAISIGIGMRSLASNFFDRESILLLAGVQSRQDDGMPWGDSVRIADSRVREVRRYTLNE